MIASLNTVTHTPDYLAAGDMSPAAVWLPVGESTGFVAAGHLNKTMGHTNRAHWAAWQIGNMQLPGVHTAVLNHLGITYGKASYEDYTVHLAGLPSADAINHRIDALSLEGTTVVRPVQVAEAEVSDNTLIAHILRGKLAIGSAPRATASDTLERYVGVGLWLPPAAVERLQDRLSGAVDHGNTPEVARLAGNLKNHQLFQLGETAAKALSMEAPSAAAGHQIRATIGTFWEYCGAFVCKIIGEPDTEERAYFGMLTQKHSLALGRVSVLASYKK